MANKYSEQEELGIEDEMPVGKYKDKPLYVILIEDKDYLIWFVDNIDKYDLSEEIQNALECDADYHELIAEYS